MTFANQHVPLHQKPRAQASNELSQFTHTLSLIQASGTHVSLAFSSPYALDEWRLVVETAAALANGPTVGKRGVFNPPVCESTLVHTTSVSTSTHTPTHTHPVIQQSMLCERTYVSVHEALEEELNRVLEIVASVRRTRDEAETLLHHTQSHTQYLRSRVGLLDGEIRRVRENIAVEVARVLASVQIMTHTTDTRTRALADLVDLSIATSALAPQKLAAENKDAFSTPSELSQISESRGEQLKIVANITEARLRREAVDLCDSHVQLEILPYGAVIDSADAGVLAHVQWDGPNTHHERERIRKYTIKDGVDKTLQPDVVLMSINGLLKLQMKAHDMVLEYTRLVDSLYSDMNFTFQK